MTTPDMKPEAPVGAAGAAPRRHWLKWALIGAGGMFVLCILAVVGLRLYFSNAYIKERVRAALEEQLGRPCAIGELEAGVLEGRLTLRKVCVLAAGGEGTADAPLSVELVDARVGLWGLVASDFKEVKAVRVDLDGLKFKVRRRLVDGRYVTDWDDVIAKLTSGPPGVWPKETGLKALDFQVHLKNSELRLADEELGETGLTGLAIDASQAGLDEPLAFKLSAGLETPRSPRQGKLQVEGELVWLDGQGRFGPSTLSKIKGDVALQDADVGHVAQYAGLAGDASDGALRWTLGRAFSGGLKLEAADLSAVRVTFGLDSDELANLWRVAEGEAPRWEAGILPAKMEGQLDGALKDGRWETGPLSVSLDAGPNRGELAKADGQRWLAFRLDSQQASAGDEPFTLSLRADVSGLCGTDLGEAFKLKGQYGGLIEARASVKRSSSERLRASGNVKTEKFFVALDGVQQPSGFQLDYDLEVARNTQGKIDQVSGKVSAQGRPFQVTTIRDLRLTSLATPDRVEGSAQLQVAINGQELWREFGPLLKVVNLSSPLEERVTGTLELESEAGRLKGEFRGTLERQHKEPAPILLSAVGDCDLAVRDRMDGSPFARFDVQLRAAQDKSFSVRMKGDLARTKEEETWTLSDFRAVGALAALGNLNERLKYVRFFLGPEYDVKGYFDQTAQSKLIRRFGDDGKPCGQRVELVTDLRLKQLDLSGPALVTGGDPLRWQEKDDVSLHLNLVQGTKVVEGVGPRDTVAIPKVVLKSGSLSLEGDLAEAEVAALTHAIDAGEIDERFKRWVSAMPSARLDASVSREAVGRLQGLGILHKEPLLAGSLRIKAQHVAAQHRVNVEQLDLQHPDWAIGLAVTGLDADALRTCLSEPPKTFSGWQKAIPSFLARVSLQPRAIDRLQTMLRERREKSGDGKASEPPLWEAPMFSGQWKLSAAYDAEKALLSVTDLECAVPAGTAKVGLPGVPLPAVLRFLDAEPMSLAGVGDLLSDFSVEAVAGPMALRHFRSLLPQGMDVSGLLKLRARYEAGKDRLFLDQLDFARTEGSTCLVTRLALTKEGGEAEEVNDVRGLLKELDFSKPLFTMVEKLSTHLRKGIRLEEVEASTADLLRFLKAREMGGSLVSDAFAGIYRFSEKIQLRGVSARKGDGADSYEIFATAQLAAAWHPRVGDDARPRREAAARLSGLAKIGPIVVKLAKAQVDVDATVLFDDMDVRSDYLAPYFVYEKPAGQPCRLQAGVSLPEKGGVSVPLVTLNGGPLTVALAKLEQSVAGAWTCAQLEVRDGPLPGRVSGFLYDSKADRLRVTFDAETVDLAKAVKYASLPKAFTASGALEKLRFSYDGRLSVLPDRMDEKDQAKAECVLREVVLSGRPLGKSADLSVNGALIATPYRLSSERLDVGLNYGATGRPAVAQRMAVAVERVEAREPQVVLAKALLEDGLPLLVRGQLQFGTPVNVDVLLDGIATLTEAMRSGPVKAGPTDLSGIRKLRLELSASAPSVVMSGQRLDKLQVPRIVFDKLQLEIPMANAEAYGGRLILHEAKYDVASSPLKHTQKIAVSGIDLHAVTSDPKKPVGKDSYQVFGKLSGAGLLSGAGFVGRERTSWGGQFKVTLDDLVAQRGDGRPRQVDIKKKVLGVFGGFLGGELGRGMALYGDDFGLFLSRMEFESSEIDVAVEKGRARVPQGLLTGKGKNAGLVLGFMGHVDLPTETFTPAFSVWPFNLPPATRKIMRMDELTPDEQEEIMQEFRMGTYHIVLTGPIVDPKPNTVEFATSFQGVLNRIDRMIAARKSGTQPEEGTTPEKKEKDPFRGLFP